MRMPSIVERGIVRSGSLHVAGRHRRRLEAEIREHRERRERRAGVEQRLAARVEVATERCPVDEEQADDRNRRERHQLACRS